MANRMANTDTADSIGLRMTEIADRYPFAQALEHTFGSRSCRLLTMGWQEIRLWYAPNVPTQHNQP